MEEKMWGTGFALAGSSHHHHHHHGSNHRSGRSKKNSRTGQDCTSLISPASASSGTSSPANLRRDSYSCKPAAPSSDRGSDQGAVQYYESDPLNNDSAAEADAEAMPGLCVSREIQDNFKLLEVLAHRHASASPSPSPSASPSRTAIGETERGSVASRRTKAPPALANLMAHITSGTASSDSPTMHSAGSATPRVLSVTPVSSSNGTRLSPPPSSSSSLDSRLHTRLLEQWQRPSDLSSSNIEGHVSRTPSFERSGSSGSARSDSSRRSSVPLVLHCKPLLSPEPSSPPPERAPGTPIVCSRALAGERCFGSPSSPGTPRTPRTPRVLPVTPVTLRKRMSLSRSPESPPSWASPSLLRRFSLSSTLHVV